MTTATLTPEPQISERQFASLSKNNFDFCRLALCVMVIFSHSFALAEGDERNEPMRIITNGQIGSGSLGVNCFFAISGFLITHSYLRSPSNAIFLLKRVLRIYPGYIVAVILGLIVVQSIASVSFQQTLRDIFSAIANSLVLRRAEPPGTFPNNPLPGVINGSLWSIPYEFKCYLLLMLLGSLGMLCARRWIVLGLFLSAAILNIAYSPQHMTFLEQGVFAATVGAGSAWLQVLPYFLAGVTFYLYRDKVSFSTLNIIIAVVATILAAGLPPAGKLFFPFFITYLLFWLSFEPTLLLPHWTRYGDFSYGTYLYAFPIQQLIVNYYPGISPILLFSLATPASIFAGAISWHLIEKHFIRMKTHLAT